MNDNVAIFDKLMPKLRDYLLMKGVDINGKLFRCINPEHEDKNPSCSIGGDHDEQVFNCFSCGSTGNIFRAANLIEGKALRGLELYHDTLPYLCKLFNIKFDPGKLSDQDKDEINLYRAYKDAASIVHSFVRNDWNADPQPEYITMIKDRGINETSMKEFMIGAIPSVEEFQSKLLDRGHKKAELQNYNLIEPDGEAKNIFLPGKIILPICNIDGRPIAFVARKHNWRGKDDPSPKYINTTTTAIYKKASILYGLHHAKQSARTKPLIVVEGYIDTIILRQAGIKNVAGLGSADFNPQAIDKLDKLGIRSIILAFDSDEGGYKCTNRALAELSTRASVRVRVKQLPPIEGYNDPDEVIRKHGRKAFESIEELAPFKWYLKYVKNTGDILEDDLVADACQIIKNEPSPLQRSRMARDLESVCTKYSYQELIGEVDSLIEDSNSYMKKDINDIIEAMNRKRTRPNANLIEVLDECLMKARAVEKSHRKNEGDPVANYKLQITNIRNQFRTRRGVCGFELKRFPAMQHIFDGFPDDECLFALAGRPNVGKSTLIRELSWDIATSNTDAYVIYMSIDDSTRDVALSIAARESGHTRDKVYKYAEFGDTIQDSVDEAWSAIENQHNYRVFDVTQGNSLMHLHDHIDYVRKRFPNMRPILFLDNFHKLNPGTTGMDMRSKFVDLSTSIKELTTRENVPIVMTVEMRKGFGKPRPDEIAETVQIEYDCKIIGLVHQEMHTNHETVVSWVRDNYAVSEKGGVDRMTMPYLELQIYKNKYSSFKGNLAYRFETDRSTLHEVEWSEVKNLYDKETNNRIKKTGSFL